jgi:hypothetical protein
VVGFAAVWFVVWVGFIAGGSPSFN